MPVVRLPPADIFPRPKDATSEVRVTARLWADIYHELATLYPTVCSKLLDADGMPGGYFELFRDEDGECLRYFPDTAVGKDERLVLVFAVGGWPGSEGHAAWPMN